MAESLLSLPQKRKHEETIATTKVYVGNLDSRVREYDVIKIFQKFGEVTNEEFMYFKSGARRGEPRGYCFIEYSTKEAAQNAIEKANGKKILGRTIHVAFAAGQKFDTQNAPIRSEAKSNRDRHSSNLSKSSEKAEIDQKINAIKAKISSLRGSVVAQNASVNESEEKTS